jgi:uncharacterized membrane protein YfcA
VAEAAAEEGASGAAEALAVAVAAAGNAAASTRNIILPGGPHISDHMDNLTQRRIIAVIGIIIAFLGLTSFIWGMLKHDQVFELMGFFFIIIAYVTTVVVKKLKEKDQADKKESAQKDLKIE